MIKQGTIETSETIRDAIVLVYQITHREKIIKVTDSSAITLSEKRLQDALMLLSDEILEEIQ